MITDPVDTIENLLRADLRREDEPHLSATALRVVADDVVTEAEELAKTASALAPTQVVCAFGRRQITVLPDGPDAQSMTAAVAQINAEAPALTARTLAGPIAIAAGGLVVAVGLGRRRTGSGSSSGSGILGVRPTASAGPRPGRPSQGRCGRPGSPVEGEGDREGRHRPAIVQGGHPRPRGRHRRRPRGHPQTPHQQLTSQLTGGWPAAGRRLSEWLAGGWVRRRGRLPPGRPPCRRRGVVAGDTMTSSPTSRRAS